MKILAIADEESKYLWDYFEESKLEGSNLIISCGDLDPRYLSFLATFTSAPVLYVHGNHDDIEEILKQLEIEQDNEKKSQLGKELSNIIIALAKIK